MGPTRTPRRVEFPSVVGRVESQNQVHVPLRHRLLRHANRLQGILPREKGLDSDQLAVAQHPVSRELLVEFNMACAPPHLDPSKPHHRIPPITQLASLEAEQVPGLPHCRVRTRYLVVASIDGPLHSSRTCGHPLDLWRRIAEQQVSFALIPSLDRLLHDLHVLLRHGYS